MSWNARAFRIVKKASQSDAGTTANMYSVQFGLSQMYPNVGEKEIHI